MGLLSSWIAGRRLARQAERFTTVAAAEPLAADVAWLARAATSGDDDHARWELRYARLALAVVTAQHDALDDRTGSAVAGAVSLQLLRDPRIAPGKRDIAEQQFNERLLVYANALDRRAAPGRTARLGAALLGFSGLAAAPAGLAREAGAILARYLGDAHTALVEVFGEATLPQHLITGQTPAATRERARGA